MKKLKEFGILLAVLAVLIGLGNRGALATKINTLTQTLALDNLTSVTATITTLVTTTLTAPTLAASTKLTGPVPATETIAAAATITANACGGLKKITAASNVTTDTTNTFTAASSSLSGCVMDVVNVGTTTITLDYNILFNSAGAADVVLGASDTVRVGATATAWYQLGATGNN